MSTIPGAFRNKEVVVVDKEILDNRPNLNYKAAMKDIFLSKEQRLHKRKKIIEMATAFYYANKQGSPGVKNPISMSGTAKFFNIPRQSFSDHLKGAHQNVAIHGYAKKGTFSDMNMELIRSIVKAVRINEDPDFEKSSTPLFASDKELINLISVLNVLTYSQKETLVQIGSQLELLAMEINTNDDVSQRHATLEKLLAFFNGPVLCVESFKLKSDDLDDMRHGLISLKKIYSAEHEVKGVSRRTISRSREKLGIVSFTSKNTTNQIRRKRINGTELIVQGHPLNSATGSPVNELETITNPQPTYLTKDQLIRDVFDKLNTIMDKKGQKTLDDLKQYKKLINRLISDLDAFPLYGDLLGAQFQKLMDFVLALSFENAVLLRDNGGGAPSIGLSKTMEESAKRSQPDDNDSNDSDHTLKKIHF
ncbi:hypothetical protein C6P45_002448 [Maudiozyma exigua]|uniref:Uncharacterized protein n=1 Tax=Maudiozyma exigua TaxID=34358 RepID=A0A9P6VYA4_MAUEX|nr:hypothetical protein C6P45_002448 [Kazachstania exigua]